MSTKALRVLAENDVEKSKEINSTLDDLDSRCESLKVNRVLKLGDAFNDMYDQFITEILNSTFGFSNENEYALRNRSFD